MNIKKGAIVALVAAFMGMLGCDKPKTDSGFQAFDQLVSDGVARTLIEDSSYDNFIAIVCRQVADATKPSASFKISTVARFSTDNIATDIGPITVNGRTLTANADTVYRFDYDSTRLAEGKAMLGSSVEVSLESSLVERNLSNGFIIVPKEIYPTSFNYPHSTANRAEALPLTWAPDPNNQYQKVNIEISYYSGLSQHNNSNLPSSVNSLVYVVADNGSFQVPQVDLERFPKGAYIGISISRAYFIRSSVNIAYIGVVEGHSTPILVTDSRNPIFANVWTAVSNQSAVSGGYCAGDINGDGNTDVIQPYSNGGTLAFLVHNIAGTSTSLICNNIMTGSGYTSIGFASGDFNGDGKDDMIQAWKSGTKIALSVFKSNGTSIQPLGTWVTDRGYSTIKVLSVDIDNDGFSDIAQVWSNNGKLAINVLKSTGSSYYTSWTGSFNENSGNLDILSADFNGDGRTDIVQLWNNGGYLAYKLYKSTGVGYVFEGGATTVEGSAGGFATVDYNADHKEDFIQGWSSSGKMSVLLHASNGSNYSSINNALTNHSANFIKLLPIKRSGEARTGFVQVYNSGNKTAFTRYWPLD